MSQTLNGRAPIDTEAHVAGDTLTVDECGTCHTNEGAPGVVTLVLPPATKGLHYLFSVEAAQALRIDPSGNETISLPTTGAPGAAGKYLGSNTVGSTVRLACFKSGSWRVVGFTGTWAAEA